MNRKHDKVLTGLGILLLISVMAILAITVATMIIQAATAGPVLYPILALVLGSGAFYYFLTDAVKQESKDEK